MDISGYEWKNAELDTSHNYLLPAVVRILESLPDKRGFDLGCGNGSVCAFLAGKGWDMIGVDPSFEGIQRARTQYPELKTYRGSCYDDLEKRYGRFPCVISLEVIEHVYDPRAFANTVKSLLEPGGVAVISTPYHGYIKNLALAVTGTLDNHFNALADHGHIKFWSVKTLTKLFREVGFESINYEFCGRIAPFAKSMIAVVKTSA